MHEDTQVRGRASGRGRVHAALAGGRAVRAVALALTVATLSACDPYGPSIDIAVARDADGGLRLLGDMCASALESVELVAGGNDEGEVTSRILITSEVTGRFEVDLDDVQEPFEVDDELAPLSELSTPFGVRLRAPDGIWATQDFEELPAPGMALFRTPADDEPVERPVEEFPQVSTDCG